MTRLLLLVAVLALAGDRVFAQLLVSPLSTQVLIGQTVQLTVTGGNGQSVEQTGIGLYARWRPTNRE